MPQGRQKSLQDIQKFIRRGRLSKKLLRDLQNFRIVKEADVECAVYYHIRRYVGEDPKWRVLARKHVQRTGHYVDLLIFERRPGLGDCPAIALELKWRAVNIEDKDRRSLYKAITVLKVRRAYWLSVTYADQKVNRLRKRREEKNRLFRVIVRLPFRGKKLIRFKESRQLFMSKMPIGCAHQ